MGLHDAAHLKLPSNEVSYPPWGFRQPKPGHGGAPHPIPMQAPQPAHGQPGGIMEAHVGKGAPWVLLSHI